MHCDLTVAASGVELLCTVSILYCMRVDIYVYDLSNGMAPVLSQQMLGTHIEAIWHTSVVLDEATEIPYGQGITIVPVGQSGHGTPRRILQYGTTDLPFNMVVEYLEQIKDEFGASRYHLLRHNCNTFSDHLAQFLTSKPLPEDILNLPSRFLNTPLGQQFEPFINAFFQPNNQIVRMFDSSNDALLPDDDMVIERTAVLAEIVVSAQDAPEDHILGQLLHLAHISEPALSYLKAVELVNVLQKWSSIQRAARLIELIVKS